jgi:hypothetical protein
MRRFLAILVILLPLAVMAAQAGSNPLTVKDPQTDTGRLLSIGSPDAHRPHPHASFQEGHGPLLLAAMNGEGGDENGNGDEDKNTNSDGEKDEDEKDEDGGWDRLWDAAKLG